MRKYEQYEVYADTKSQAFKRLRVMLKQHNLTLQPYAGRKIVELEKGRYKIYYKSQPRKRLK